MDTPKSWTATPSESPLTSTCWEIGRQSAATFVSLKTFHQTLSFSACLPLKGRKQWIYVDIQKSSEIYVNISITALPCGPLDESSPEVGTLQIAQRCWKAQWRRMQRSNRAPCIAPSAPSISYSFSAFSSGKILIVQILIEIYLSCGINIARASFINHPMTAGNVLVRAQPCSEKACTVEIWSNKYEEESVKGFFRILFCILSSFSFFSTFHLCYLSSA